MLECSTWLFRADLFLDSHDRWYFGLLQLVRKQFDEEEEKDLLSNKTLIYFNLGGKISSFLLELILEVKLYFMFIYIWKLNFGWLEYDGCVLSRES